MKFIHNDNNQNMSGVYKILNLLNGRVYIGSTINFRKRYNHHFYFLNANKHRNQFLQNDFNKCGVENFIFEILEISDRNEICSREQIWLDQYFDHQKQCYNINPKADSRLGIKLSENTKKTIGDLARKRMLDPNTRQKLINSAKEYWSEPKNCKKMSELHQGMKHSEETKQKISLVQKKRFSNPNEIKKYQNYWKSLEKEYSLIAPTGEIFIGQNLAKFCSEQNLNYGHMVQVNLGKVKSYKKWRSTKPWIKTTKDKIK